MLVLNQKHLNLITRDYVHYDNRNRPHQGSGTVNPDAAGWIRRLPVRSSLFRYWATRIIIIGELPD